MTTPLLEEAAQAAYLAGMELRSDKGIRIEPWEKLPEHWKRIYRAHATAILNIIQPAPPAIPPAEPDVPLFDMEGTTP